jgi:hypothetical protein
MLPSLYHSAWAATYPTVSSGEDPLSQIESQMQFTRANISVTFATGIENNIPIQLKETILRISTTSLQ